jgi:hypothetical protein
MFTIFGDPGGADCAVYDTQPNTVVSVYVFQLFAPESFAAQFSVPIPACAVGLTWLGDTHVFLATIGESPTGIAMGFGACYSTPVHVLTINYFGMGASEECCLLRVEPDYRETPPGIYMTDCDFVMFPATGGAAIINPNEGCPCISVPTQETTWGRVKALYQK